tara:strand:- start:1194 stop:2021 length:828 start_codon:yes stop_codon:yes gene_type:complete
MFKFVKHQKYRRLEIWEVVKGKDEKMSRNFHQSGYERINEDLFAFINIGYKGHAGQIFPNKYDPETETVFWYGKKETHSNQPLMRSIIDGFTNVYCFARWNSNPEFTFLGIGKVVNYRDNFTDVYDLDGTQTFCIEFELNCSDSSESPAFINNFDSVYEDVEIATAEGKAKYVRHKTRERNPEIVKAKKREFKNKHGRLFCEACGFDFANTYGSRGDGFIECHHNVPLHEEEEERVTKTSDLTLLCSNCHRMIHRKKKWLTVEELKSTLDSQKLK